MLRTIRRLLELAGRLPTAVDLGGYSRYGLAALQVLEGELGKGEAIGTNNRGENIERWKTDQFTGRRVGGHGAWCMALQCYAIERAAINLGEDRSPIQRTHSARRGWLRIADHGARVVRPEVGVWALWKRDGGHHIELVCKLDPEDRDVFWSRGGNVGPNPAPVRDIKHHVDEPRLIGFARLD